MLTGPEPVPMKTGYSWMDEAAVLSIHLVGRRIFPSVQGVSEDLARRMEMGLRSSEDPVTQAHLKDCLKGIDLILNPKK